MRVELLFWDGCPSHPKALAQLREAVAEAGLDPSAIIVRAVSTQDQAEQEGFIGSPTIRFDGVDILPTGAEPPALTCRIYRLRDGRFSPTPDPADLRAALACALQTTTERT